MVAEAEPFDICQWDLDMAILRHSLCHDFRIGDLVAGAASPPDYHPQLHEFAKRPCFPPTANSAAKALSLLGGVRS